MGEGPVDLVHVSQIVSHVEFSDELPRMTPIYDRRRQNFDRHAAYVVVASVAGG